MHAQHDHNGTKGAKEDRQEPGCIVLHHRENGLQPFAHQVTQRPDNAEHQRGHDQEGQQRTEEELNDLWRDFIRQLLDPRCHIDHQNHRNDGRCIGGQSHRQEAKHLDRFTGIYQGSVIGVDHH